MHIFSKGKKGDTVKPLTEEEIQERLYGEYKKGDLHKPKYKGLKHQESTAKNQEAHVEVLPIDDAEQELFSFEKPRVYEEKSDAVKEMPMVKEEKQPKIVVPQKPTHKDTTDTISGNDKQTIIDSFEIDERILEHTKPSETVTYTFPEEKTESTSPVADQKKISYTQSFKDTLSSFKIDLAEFIDKVKTISPMVIGLAILTIVFLIIVFNMWSRSSRDNKIFAPINSVEDKTPVTTQTIQPPVQSDRVPADSTTVDEAIAPETPSDGAIPQDMVPPQATAATSFYTIQICVYEDTQRSLDLVARLKQNGIDAFFDEITTRSGRSLYTVYRGHFKTLRSANTAFTDFKKTDDFKQFPDSFIKWIK